MYIAKPNITPFEVKLKDMTSTTEIKKFDKNGQNFYDGVSAGSPKKFSQKVQKDYSEFIKKNFKTNGFTGVNNKILSSNEEYSPSNVLKQTESSNNKSISIILNFSI